MGVAEFFASETFLFLYSGLIVIITIVAIIRNQLSLAIEARVAREIIAVVNATHSKDATGKIAQLLRLNESTGARILTHAACRSDDLGQEKTWQHPKFATARATANYLSLMAAVPAERHSLEGLRPARNMIEDDYRRLHRGLNGFGDFIIRVALLGTFMGLIAALSIASANIGIEQGSEAAQSAHMRDFIQVLLATAANKFWISAVGIASAIVVQIYRSMSEKAGHISRLGEAFDRAITDPDIAAAWCPPLASERHTSPMDLDQNFDFDFVRNAVLDRLSELNIEPLNEAIGEIAATLKANAKDSFISIGPGLSRRGGE